MLDIKRLIKERESILLILDINILCMCIRILKDRYSYYIAIIYYNINMKN